ncbi:thiamine-phosphate kinase [Sandarakinorhabdus sp.]|uniref:thiamine-phosphate kinase n=1 Tax=Sandarakinorhabdus sp. TaxID=1916663 RepID=UPI00286D8733|nr:thiamine-phosphate kinase [Sandarakinorhabdus sp.]
MAGARGFERGFIADVLAPLASDPVARGLTDDAAVWTPPLGRDLVFTHDVLAAGVHFLGQDPPGDIAWKLLAVNLSDLAAMAAQPVGVLMGLGLSAAQDEAWRADFAAGLGRALVHFGVALWGGDTVTGLDRAVIGLTAIGTLLPGAATGRDGARPGDGLYVSGTIGDAGLGLAMAQGTLKAETALLKRYRLPMPRVALGRVLAGCATACMDVSDGLLIDAQRLAAASGVAIEIDLAAMPVSDAARRIAGDDDAGRLRLATSGDDYELLFTAPPGFDADAAALSGKVAVTRIGTVSAGMGLHLTGQAGPIALPARLGWEH